MAKLKNYKTVFPANEKNYGNLGFKLGSSDENLRLYNADELINSVAYESDFPWYEATMHQQIRSVSIFNLYGKLIQTHNILSNKKIQVENLSKDLYILIKKTSEKTYSSKFLKL